MLGRGEGWDRHLLGDTAVEVFSNIDGWNFVQINSKYAFFVIFWKGLVWSQHKNHVTIQRKMQLSTLNTTLYQCTSKGHLTPTCNHASRYRSNRSWRHIIYIISYHMYIHQLEKKCLNSNGFFWNLEWITLEPRGNYFSLSNSRTNVRWRNLWVLPGYEWMDQYLESVWKIKYGFPKIDSQLDRALYTSSRNENSLLEADVPEF